MQWLQIFVFSCLVVSSRSNRPNILIFMADDLGYGDIGAFGNDTLRTPYIDSIAKGGMKFTHLLTPAAVCTPSRAAFLTGRYPVRLGMTGRDNGIGHQDRALPHIAAIAGLPRNETTFAEVAKRSGYTTGYIGKWHVGSYCNDFGDFCGHPLRRGFDYFYGCLLTFLKDFGEEGESILISIDPNYAWKALKTSSMALFVPIILWLYGLVGRKGISIILIIILIELLASLIKPYHGMRFATSVMHRNYDVVEMPIRFENLTQRLVWESIEFLEKASKRKETPFLLFISWFHVHTALYNSVPEFRGRSAHGPYGDNVEEMDWSTGQVLNALDRLGLTKDTLVVFTSDNGGHVEETDHLGRRAGGHNGPWRGGKAHGGWDGGYRVPTIVRWPGIVPPGSSTDEPTSNMDFFPTFASIMGQPLHPKVHLDGVSLLPVLRGSKKMAPLGERFMFFYCANRIFSIRWRNLDTVWKLRLASPPWLPGSEQCSFLCPCFDRQGVESHSEPLLYNLSQDSEERYPIKIKMGSQMAVRERMLEALEDHKTSIGDVTNQFTLGKTMYRPWLQPCCNFPLCQCRDAKWIK